jgi:hypothetical protein
MIPGVIIIHPPVTSDLGCRSLRLVSSGEDVLRRSPGYPAVFPADSPLLIIIFLCSRSLSNLHRLILEEVIPEYGREYVQKRGLVEHPDRADISRPKQEKIHDGDSGPGPGGGQIFLLKMSALTGSGKQRQKWPSREPGGPDPPSGICRRSWGVLP